MDPSDISDLVIEGDMQQYPECEQANLWIERHRGKIRYLGKVIARDYALGGSTAASYKITKRLETGIAYFIKEPIKSIKNFSKANLKLELKFLGLNCLFPILPLNEKNY